MSATLAGARDSHAEELRSARLYRALARIERDPRIAALFARLGEAAEEQARVWADKLRAAGEAPPETVALGARARAALALAGLIGVRPMRPVFAALKVRGLSIYGTAAPPGHPQAVTVEDIGRRHRTGGG
ncbi:MAG TPA: hypothetical protein PKJ79_06830, partial [Quisquiliibacterium sp.]|nr:hypothetical protein [Quisquiliibacterium sp.]